MGDDEKTDTAANEVKSEEAEAEEVNQNGETSNDGDVKRGENKKLPNDSENKLEKNGKKNDDIYDDSYDEEEAEDDETYAEPANKSIDEFTKISDTKFCDLGGIGSVLDDLKKEVMVHVSSPHALRNMGLKAVSGILLCGPPGCGKTKLAHALANETNLPFHYLSLTKLISRYGSGYHIRNLFKEAYKTAISIVFIDDIHKISKNTFLKPELLTCIDEANSKSSDSTPSHIFVIGATNNLVSVDPDLRKAGRFDREIFMGFPEENARMEILSVLTRNLRLKDSVDFVKLSKLTSGFVGGDLEKLVDKACSLAKKRIIDERKMKISANLDSDAKIDEWWKQTHWLPELEDMAHLFIEMADFELAVKMVQPVTTVPGGPRFSDFGGISSDLEELKMEIMAPLRDPFVLQNLGVKLVTGILFHGPPGCGKTKMAHAIANEASMRFHLISCNELVSDIFTSSEAKIKSCFMEAYKTAPSIVCIDEIDSIALKKEEQKSKRNRKLAAQLLTCIDKCHQTSFFSPFRYIIVIGTTNRLDALDPDFRRPGRFDREIAFGIPDERARVEILSALTRNLNLDGSVDLAKVSRSTPKLVGADLETLVNKVGQVALRRIVNQRKSKVSGDPLYMKDINGEKQALWVPNPGEIDNLRIIMSDFEEAVKIIKAVEIPVSGPTFNDLGGMSSVLEELKMEVIVPLYYPFLLCSSKIKPVSGILLHGPPGCGKTTLAYAIANEIHVPFHYISAAKILADRYNSAQERLQLCLEDAQRTAPSIVFVDEIDAIASKSKKVDWSYGISRELGKQLLTWMDEFNLKSSDFMPYSIVVIGATNKPAAINAEFRSLGRFDREISIDVPDENARVDILSVLTRNKCLDDSVDLVNLSKSTPEFTGADLAALVNVAGNQALKRIVNQRKSELPTDSQWWEQPQWHLEVKETKSLCIQMADFEAAAKQIQISKAKLDISSDKVFCAIPDVTWDDVGGLDSLRQEFDRLIIRRIKNPKEYEEFGIDLDVGFLLHGPPGCGKTLVVKAVANGAGANFIHIKGPEIRNCFVGKTEQKIRDIFNKARKCSPCIIFFDEVDSLTASRGGVFCYNDSILNQLLVELDGGDKRDGVFVIGATNRPEIVDPAILRPGRLGKLIGIPLPDADGRASILKALSRKKPIDSDVDFHVISRMRECENFTGAHLAALTNEAAMIAMEEKLSSQSCLNSTMPSIKMTHFKQALPSIAQLLINHSGVRWRELSNIPDVKWKDVGGLDLLRKEFDRYIIKRIKHPEVYEKFGIDLDTGFLLHGPPGCGKTLIAMVVAYESGANFIHIKGPELLNKYVGVSELAVREVFNQARTCSPCIIFFDEVDALTSIRGESTTHVRDSVLNQLLIELDGGDKRKGVFVIGATNRLDVMDPAVLRPGRFGKSIYVPLPDADGRESILKAISRKKPIDSSVNFHAIARMNACKNLSGADLAALINEAAMAALEENLDSFSNQTVPTIKPAHFELALQKIKPSVTTTG